MTTGVALPLPVWQVFNNAGQPNVGGSVLFQVGGVNTAIFQDVGLTIPLPNPTFLNSRGEISNASGLSCQVFFTPNTVYVATVYDANGNQINQFSYINGIAGPSQQSIIPVVDNSFTLGSRSPSSANVYVGRNHAALLDAATGNSGYYARTAAEIAALVI